ncbi:MAG: tetratricopeptide repeat protein [Thermoplasmatota archaeon]
MFPAHERKKTGYVGRKEELSRLAKILDEVKIGKGALVMVEGEAGIGKTRFTSEMRGIPQFEDFKFLWGRCLYFKDTDIYLPFKEMFNQYKEHISQMEGDMSSPFPIGDVLSPEDEMGNDYISEESFVPMSLIPAEVGLGEDEDEEEGMLVEGLLRFDKLSQFIFNLSQQGPLCLLIDDLHWADPPSLQLLQYLSQKIKDQPILIVCTYRPEDLFWGGDNSHPLAEALKRLNRDRLYYPVKLKRLSRDEVEAMVRDILSVGDVPSKFLELVYNRTMGNPFFVEEVIYSLMERGIIDTSSPDWFTDLDPKKISLPTTLKDVILRRVHWLKPVSIKVIRFASVTGESFNYDIIKEALDLSDEAVIEALEELTHAKFINESEEEEHYEFENPVIQEVIYSELNHSRRRFLHSKLAKVLEKRFTDTPVEWGNIAIHYYKGKEYENALKYLTRASSYYQHISPHRALEYLHMVLDCIERLPQSDSVKTQHMHVLHEISNLCMLIGDWKRSREFAEKSLNLSMILKDTQIEIKTKLTIAEILRMTSDFDKALTYYNEVVRLSQVQEYSEGLAVSYMGIGFIRWRKGDYPKALEMFSKSLQYAKLENNLKTIGTLYLHIGNLFNHRGDLKKSIDYYQRGVRHLESSGDLFNAARGYSNKANVLLQLGEIEEAEKVLSTALEKSKQKGGTDNWWPYINLIRLRSIQGNYAEAGEVYNLVLDLIKELGDKHTLGLAAMYMGDCRSRMGDYSEAETLLGRSMAIFEELEIPYDIGRVKMYLGENYTRREKTDEARNMLSEAHRIFQSIGANHQREVAKEELKEIMASEK